MNEVTGIRFYRECYTFCEDTAISGSSDFPVVCSDRVEAVFLRCGSRGKSLRKDWRTANEVSLCIIGDISEMQGTPVT